MKTVTYKQLVKMGACDDWLDVFHKVFGERMVVNPKNLAKARERNMPVNWFLKRVNGKEYTKKLDRLVRTDDVNCLEAAKAYYRATKNLAFTDPKRYKHHRILEDKQSNSYEAFLQNLRRMEDKMFLSLASSALTATRKPRYPERKSAKKNKGGGHGRKR